MRLYICSTYYHVYITLLKQFATPTDTDLVVCDDIPTGKKLTERLSATGLFQNVWYVEQSKFPEVRGKNWLDWTFFQHRRRAKQIRPLLPFHLEDYADVYIYHDGTPLGMYLADAKKRYHLIEDSLDFYKTFRSSAQVRCLHKRSWKYGLQWILNAGYFPLGESRIVIDIEVNDRKNLQIKGQAVVECPRDILEKSLTANQKQYLLDIFGYTDFEIGDKTALLLTEPLYKDGIVPTVQDQESIYRDIIRDLCVKGYIPVIKPHPRDEVDYSNWGCQVIDRCFPAELFSLSETKNFPCVAAVRSSGLKQINADKKLYFPIKKKETEDGKSFGGHPRTQRIPIN